MSSISRRGFLLRGSVGVTALALLPGVTLTGCAQQGLLLGLPSGREVAPGEVVASGVAYQGETPDALFLRVTTNAVGESMEIQRLRGLVTWRVVTADGSQLVTVGQDALPTQYQFAEGVVVEFTVTMMVDTLVVTDGDTLEELLGQAPQGTELVVLRDHKVIPTDADYVPQDGDYAVYVDPRDEEPLVA